MAWGEVVVLGLILALVLDLRRRLMAREQELNDKLDALSARVGEIRTYVLGIKDDLANGAGNQPAIDAAIAKADAILGVVEQTLAEKQPDPTP